MRHNSYWNNHALTKRPTNIQTRKSWFTITGNSKPSIKKPLPSIVEHLKKRSKKLNTMSIQQLKDKLNRNLKELNPNHSPKQNPLLKFKNSRENRVITKKRIPNPRPFTVQRMAHLRNKNPDEYVRVRKMLERENPKSIRIYKPNPKPLTRKRMANLEKKNPGEYARLMNFLEKEKS